MVVEERPPSIEPPICPSMVRSIDHHPAWPSGRGRAVDGRLPPSYRFAGEAVRILPGITAGRC